MPRARLAVLSELASSWRLWLRRWSLMNRSHRSEVHGESAPSRADEYHFYQALIAVWPADAERLKAYMLKSAREAKARTSWINPDVEYEAAARALRHPVAREPAFPQGVERGAAAYRSSGPAREPLAGAGEGRLTRRTRLLPGHRALGLQPRRPRQPPAVDFATRAKFLDQLAARPPKPAALLANLSDGRAKLHVIRQGLAVRKAHPELFHGGKYRALHADAGYEENVIAFSLGDRIVAVAPRLFARRLGDADAPIGEFWGEARLTLPQGEFEDVLSGAHHAGGATALA